MRKKVFIITLLIVISLGSSAASSSGISCLFNKNIVGTNVKLFLARYLISDPPPSQVIVGYINYSDSSWTPNGVVVTATNTKNDNSITTTTLTGESGHTGTYMFADIFLIPGTEDGDTIRINVSYGGCIGEDTLVINISLPSQVCDITIYGNLPPVIPDSPSGPTSGYIDITYNYSTYTWDPNNDDIYYWFDWGDGTNSGWLGSYSSNETCTSSHTWNASGTYQVKTKAKDSMEQNSVHYGQIR